MEKQKTGKLGNYGNRKLENLKTGKVENWESRKLENWKTGQKKKMAKISKTGIFLKKKGLGSTYTPYWCLTSCKISKKCNETILSNIYKKVDFIQLLCPLLLLFALFRGKKAFLQNKDV